MKKLASLVVRTPKIGTKSENIIYRETNLNTDAHPSPPWRGAGGEVISLVVSELENKNV